MKGKIVFFCLLDVFFCSVIVIGVVKKSLFEYFVYCGIDEVDKIMKIVRFKVIYVYVYVYDCF